MAESSKRALMTGLRLLAMAGVILRASPLRAAESPGQILRTPIAPGLSISVDISTSSPYLGQQFSIVYSLVAQRYPTAVDVQPQQFSGFWTEVVPLPQETRTITRLVGGRPTHEFLLRQVIAYAMEEGDLLLPPLAVKIMITGALAPGSTNWDVEGASKPVPIRVLPLPDNPEPDQHSLLVGTLEGRLKPAERGEGMESFLELQGTANIAFFQPQEWLRSRGATFLPPRLLKAGSEIDTMDVGGKRKLTLVLNRTWAIRLLPSMSEEIRIDDLRIPVFLPGADGWKEARIKGLSFRTPSGIDTASRPSYESRARRPGELRAFLNRYGLLSLALIAGLAAACASGWLVRRRREIRSSEHRVMHDFGKLEKQSHKAPRSFLETAHKIMVCYASENQVKPATGIEEMPFDQCWFEIERCRFNGEEPSAEKREQIMQLMRTMLKGEKTRSGSEPQP